MDETKRAESSLQFAAVQFVYAARNVANDLKRLKAPNDVVQPLVDACDAADTAMNNGQYLLDTSTLSYASTRAVVWLRAYQRNNPIDS